MALGIVSGIGDLGSTPTPTTSKLYQIVVNITISTNNYNFSFYSTSKIENFSDLYNKILALSDYKIYCNVNSGDSCTSGELRVSGQSVTCQCQRNGTAVVQNITSSSTGVTYLSKEM